MRFGKLIWSQPREITVLNYTNHLVYQIYTNHGYISIAHNKTNDKIDISNGSVMRFESLGFSKSEVYESEKVFLPACKQNEKRF